MTVSRRGVARVLVSIAALAALAVPAAVALATGWIEITVTAWGETPGPDPTPIEAWVLLALVYLVWAPLVFAGVVLLFDRLGYKYMPVERPPRTSAKKRRLQRSGMKYLQSQQAPRRRKDGR
jgi:hypothetical protein